MINIKHAELAETVSQSLPSASSDTLRELREDMCSQSASRDFKLQNYQRFLRRVLSPDSPTRSLLMVHGTGTGKTCTAIQIAEEYIIRPEFQEKTVLVLANPAVQENFKTQIFNINKVTIDPDGILLSKQCTGRRYLDMLLRIQNEPMKWTDKETRERIDSTAQTIIKEFYEFKGYNTFANEVRDGEDSWIHKTFDNRLIIIDEAHNIRVTEEGEPTKLRSIALERVIKTAKNITLILLTATPMFDQYDEVIFYFNLFLMNERKDKESLSKIFTKSGDFAEGMESVFRNLCQTYISFIKGDNPLTFPFRLPPPPELVATPATHDIKDVLIPKKDRRSVLTLTQSVVQGLQEETLQKIKTIKKGFSAAEPTLCVFPENAKFDSTFVKSQSEDSEYKYAKDVPKFLAPSKIDNHSSKFSLITKTIAKSKGLIFVYSNLVDFGAQLFAMCLEEHGYESAIGKRLLESTSGEVERGSSGKYMLFTSDISETERRRGLERVKNPANKEGADIKVIVASPSISEGVDLQYVRQVHVLEYWWNMSRIEQVVGRGIRTCSHQLLPFEDQNCTVYLHICKFSDSTTETIDEYYYRTFVEAKAKSIAKIKHIIMESAMDCPLQQDINSMPEQWRNLSITQNRSQGDKPVSLTLGEMSSPMFDSNAIVCNTKELPDEEHDRPLSAYTDVRDELLDKFLKLFLKKPVWLAKDLFDTPELMAYDDDVILYTLQNAIETGFQLKDRNGRIGHLESRGKMYAFAVGTNDALQDRYIKEDRGVQAPIQPRKIKQKPVSTLESKRATIKWSESIKKQFSQEILDWYIVDHVLTEEEHIQYILSLDELPDYMKHLKVGNLLILGNNKIYEDGELITPIGEQADIVNNWIAARVNLFLSTREKIFATMKNGSILFNLDEKADVIKRVERSKVIGGRNCTSFPDSLLSTFAEWLGTSFSDLSTKPERCQFIALLFRKAVLDKKEGIQWWTPEEWSIFTLNDDTRKELLSKLKLA